MDSERHVWASSYEQGAGSRAALRRHRGPYLAAVVPQIADCDPDLPPAVLAESSDAAQELARFDGELGAEIAPFAAVLLRSESAASSQIEDLTASARAVAEATLGQPAGPNAQQVVGNVEAMRAAVSLADELTGDAILAMHAALMRRTDPEGAGRWRTEQVWIGGSALGPHGATFVPPHHDRVPAAIEDLRRFADRVDLPVLVHVALAHAQFETIHPFTDGNGRTGRALVHAMLRGAGLVRNVTVPVSAGLLADVDRYFDALTAYRDGDVVPVVERFAEASYAAVTNGRALVEDLRSTRASWDDRVRVRRGALAWDVADLLLRLPVVNARLLADELGVLPQNVYRTLAPLEDAGVLTASGGSRNRTWRAQEVLDAVDAFAARARRGRPPRR
ncbi:Fic family protein [Thalassiella azotivora]